MNESIHIDDAELTPEDLLGTLNDVERKNAPPRIFVAGDRAVFEAGPRIAVVGSRAASSEGLRRAKVIAARLVERRMVVVSGLAAGVDTVAHATAIEGGGRTLAVLGTPLDESFPAENRALQQRIMREHLAVSQFKSGTPGGIKNFPIRNRTMALLTDATIIIEAGEKSGTLHQGWEALRLGRLLFLLESVATNSALTWPAEMIRYGAQVLSRKNLDTVLDHLPQRPAREEVPF